MSACQSNILTDCSALSDTVSASLLADLTMNVPLIFEKKSVTFFQDFALQGRDLFKAFSAALLNILH